MLSLRYKNNFIPYVNTSGNILASGAIVILAAGLHGGIGVVDDIIAIGATGAVSVWDVHELAALSTDTWSVGARLYWDNTNFWLTAESAVGQFAGFATFAKIAGTTTGFVALVGLMGSESATAAALLETSITDSTGGTPSATLAAITAGATYAQADAVATKNALSSLAAQLNSLTTNLRAVGAIT